MIRWRRNEGIWSCSSEWKCFAALYSTTVCICIQTVYSQSLSLYTVACYRESVYSCMLSDSVCICICIIYLKLESLDPAPYSQGFAAHSTNPSSQPLVLRREPAGVEQPPAPIGRGRRLRGPPRAQTPPTCDGFSCYRAH